MKKVIALILALVLLAVPVTALAEIVRIVDSTTGLVYLYDTATGSLHLEIPEPEEPKIPEEPNKPIFSDRPIPGLNYSTDTTIADDKERAIVGKGYVVEATNYALNGAVKLSVTEKNGKSTVKMVDRNGNTVKSRGYVRVCMRVPKGTPEPFRVKVDGKITNFEFVPGTDYVDFSTVFK